MLFDHGGDLIGLAITAGIVYFIAQLFIPSDGQQHVEESQDDYHARLQQEDDDAYYRQEEENRINQENIANQEALDRLS